jgi:FAD/FMN-containing dehydrogenase
VSIKRPEEKPMTSNSGLLTSLQQIFSKDELSTEDHLLQEYGRDWTRFFKVDPLAIVFPSKSEQVRDLVLWAKSQNVSLVPSGGRTGLSGGAVASNRELVVSFDKMKRIYEFNSVDQSVKVEAGVITEALQNFAADQGLLYPVDFAARGSSQIGGNIATNAGGIKVIRYGMTREWVSDLQVVTGQGRFLSLGRRDLIKNATGPDLKHLFIGSEGIFGFITSATMRLCPPAPETQVFLLSCPNLKSIVQIFLAFRARVVLQAFEAFSDKCLEKVLAQGLLSPPSQIAAPYMVVLEFECLSDSTSQLGLETFEKLVEQGLVLDGSLASTAEQKKTFWSYRENISEALSGFTPYKNDISVPIQTIESYVSELEQIVREKYPQFEVMIFGHIGDGNLHINVLRPENLTPQAFYQECQVLDQIVYNLVDRFGGSISAEHGVGLTKKKYLSLTRSDQELSLLKEMKAWLDPKGICNPGKLI